MGALDVTLLYLLAAVLGVVAFRSLKLPPMLGYLSVGILIGPHALSVLGHSQSLSRGMTHLGEFGVVFLMFVIGLEFNLKKLKAMKGHVFGLGFSQVAVTLLVVPLVAFLLTYALPFVFIGDWRMDGPAAIALAAALAMSSTAIVVKLMSERAELSSEHGRRVMGVLLFQDLAVVPLLVLIPALASPSEKLVLALVIACFKGFGLVALLLIGGQKLMHGWLTLVIKRKSEELFVLNILLITLGLAWLTEKAGLSMALGAFIAGILISETPYKHHVQGEIRPFHDVLLGLFFISIGTLLDWRLVLAQWWLVLVLALVPVFFKFITVALLVSAFGGSRAVALRTGLYLAQAGEFGFVLLTLASEQQLIAPALLNPVLAGMVVSMLATPFIIMNANRIVMGLIQSEWMRQSLNITKTAIKAMGQRNHVIICGYGRSGQNLLAMLAHNGVAAIAMDADPELIEHMQETGYGDTKLAQRKVVYGDCTKASSLHALGLARAKALVVSFIDIPAAHRIIDLVKHEAPHVKVIVRTRDDQEIEALLRAGATEVVPDALEGSLMLASHALLVMGTPMRRVLRAVQDNRKERYKNLRNYYDEDDDGHH